MREITEWDEYPGRLAAIDTVEGPAARQRYRGGLSTYLVVLDAPRQLYPAEFDLAQTHRDQLLVVVRLYRALGGGWNSYEAKAPPIPAPIAP